MEYDKIIVVLTTPPGEGLRPYSAVRFTERAAMEGKEAILVCIADGVLCMKRSKSGEEEVLHGWEQRIRQVIEKGAKVMVCQAPLNAFGLGKEELIDGVEVVDDVFSMVVKKDAGVFWL